MKYRNAVTFCAIAGAYLAIAPPAATQRAAVLAATIPTPSITTANGGTAAVRNASDSSLTATKGSGEGLNQEQPQQPPPAVLPFGNFEFSAVDSSQGVTSFFQQADGTYISLQFGWNAPYPLVSPASELTQWLSGGLKSLLAAPARPAGTGSQSQACTFADLDGTGMIGSAAIGDNSVSVYRISDTAPTTLTYPIGSDVNSVFFADFNGDGKADLAVAYDGGGGPGGIAILLGNGDGTFGNPVTYASGTQASNFAVFDLNHDGALDIATVSFDSTVTVLLGKGDGTFGVPAQYAVGAASPVAIAIADFNGDGVPDIAVGGATGILLGNGNGTFRTGTPLPQPAGVPWALAAGDLDGDGKMDLAYTDGVNQVIIPLFGNGDGTFLAGQPYAVSTLPVSLVLADYNHDGRPDIIDATGDARIFGPAGDSYNIDILLNNGDRTFQGAPTYLAPGPSPPGFLQNGVGAATAKFGGTFPGVLASSSRGTLTLFPGDGKGGFQAPQNFILPEGQAGAIAAADFNGDGLADAAVINGSDVAILLGTAGGFGTPTTISGLSPASIVTGDFDGDGKTDLVVMSAGAGGASSPGTLTFLKGNGKGMFSSPVTIPAGFNPVYAYAVDLNADEKLDLVFADNGQTNGQGAGVYVALNAGSGVFQAPVQVFTALNPAFGIGDVNGDGKLDLVASTVLSPSLHGVVSWLAGNGNGTFQAPISISTSVAPIDSIVVQDLNDDGIPDIVLAQQGYVSTFLAGYGNGAFSAEIPFWGPNEPTLLLTTDLNGDGKPDLIVLGTAMSVLLNSPPIAVTIQTNPPGLQFLVDQDGAALTAPVTLSLSPGPHMLAVGTPQPEAAGSQYAFTGWSDGGAGEHMITVGTSAATYTASFSTQYELTISASPGADGTVTPATGTFYDAGTVVPVTAPANSGYTFTSWTGSVASASSSTTTVTMNAPQAVTANFSLGGSGPPAFFNGEVSLGGGVYYLQFPNGTAFGYYNFPSFPILYHYDMGFEAFVDGGSGAAYLYDFLSAHWFYTSSTLFPYLYDFTLNTWIYYFPDTKNPGHYTTKPRYFSNLTSGKIFTM